MTPIKPALGAPFTIPEIVAAFEVESEVIETFFGELPDETFFVAPAGLWSPAENLAHLNLSAAPVIRALALPRWLLRVRFGKAGHASRSLAEVRDLYVNGALAGGGEAGGDYTPMVTAQTVETRAQILATWRAQSDKLTRAILNWTERNLDRLLLPHPLLGKMTVREILLFTLYHNLHHVNDVERLLNRPESEWFTS